MRTRLLPVVLLFHIALATSHAGAASVGPGCEFTDLQAAIDAADPAGDSILVTSGYVGAPIHLDGRRLEIIGGVQSCTDASVVGTSTLDGGIDADAVPVLDVGGTANVDIANFEITGAHNDGGDGGGVRFVSRGAESHLGLHRVHVSDNRAGAGAGIFFDAHTPETLLHEIVLDAVRIEDNVAHVSGGGIRLAGHAHLVMDAESSIARNTADPANSEDGRGGGIEALADSRADIAGVLSGNHARLGGGIAMHDRAVVQLASVARDRPVAVRQNDAAESGGGVWSIEHGRLCAFGYAIDDNTAPTGAAVDMHGTAGFNSTEPCSILRPDYHNSISGNRADDDGDIVFVELGLFSDKLAIAHNRGGALLAGTSSSTIGFGASILSNCEIQHNAMQRALFDFEDVIVESCTLADNTVAPDAPLFVDRGLLDVEHSIVWQPGIATVARAEPGAGRVTFNAALVADERLGEEADSVANVTTGTDPAFVDAANGDYRLRPESAAVDYHADCLGNAFVEDEIGATRGFVIRNATTPCDLGALELTDAAPPPEQSVFANGFD